MTKKKWLGVLLSLLVPGLGSFYAQKMQKGVIIYLVLLVLLVTNRFVAFNFTTFLTSIILILLYLLFNIFIGYRDVKKDFEYPKVKFDKWFVYLLVIIVHIVMVNSNLGKILDKITPINYAGIVNQNMLPSLEVDDKIAFKKTKNINRNDVSIFWFPEDIKTMYVKRCVAVPGDNFIIKDGIVYINNEPLDANRLYFKYLVETNGALPEYSILNQLGATQTSPLSSDTYEFYISKEIANELLKLPQIKSVELSFWSEGVKNPAIFPKSGSQNWNEDNFGPIYLPKKGDKIKLTQSNIELYSKCIEFENTTVEIGNSKIKIDGVPISNYTFKENYYFMMGDNRHHSYDSRFWGLLPEKLIIGKALYKIWSENKENIGKKVE